MKRFKMFLGMGIILILTALTFAIVPSGVEASVPKLINFQGILKTPADTVVSDGSYSVTFTIYPAPTGGINLWTETQSVTTANGLFAVLLGTSNPVPDSAFKGSDLWLGIAVSPDGEMSQRQRLVSVGYAYRVSSVDGALGGNILTKVSIGPGHTNTGTNAFVAGENNKARGNWSTVSGGGGATAFDSNAALGDYSSVGGGFHNAASGYIATVGGGNFNTASGQQATVGGGLFDTASGVYATVPGGLANKALGDYSFAAGRSAKANHPVAFVWADRGDAVFGTDFASSAINEFSVRAQGGTRIFSNLALTAGVTLAPGASAWGVASDSNLKRNIRLVDGKEILSKVARLPIKRWSYKAQDPSIEHIGPMAQDFYPLFKVGDDEKTISTIDPPGIALAAIQGLYQIVQEHQVENDELRRELKDLRELVQTLLAEKEEKSAKTLTVTK